jgi:hypothetical protein
MPSAASTFRTAEPMLHDLLDRVHRGAIQLPDFQRGWVWDDDHIRSLLASITLSYPIGAVMSLETGGEGVRFKPRLFEGVDLDPEPEPEKLILDGQQRLTSLYLALRSTKAVPTRSKHKQPIRVHYYLDIARALEPESELLDAIESVPEDRVIKADFNRKVLLDLSSPEREWTAGKIPFEIFFDYQRFAQWRSGYLQHREYSKEANEDFTAFEQQIHFRFQQYKIPVIELLRETPKEAVCQVFEKVNTGGVSLTVFELLTATFAADNFTLRDDWSRRQEALAETTLLGEVSASDFLTAATLLTSVRKVRAGQRMAVSCKRGDTLNLSLDEYRASADDVVEGLKKAQLLLLGQGIYETRNLPYDSQLIPLSVICALLGDRFHHDGVKGKVARWYWCGVFGELYGGATESRYDRQVGPSAEAQANQVVAFVREHGEAKRADIADLCRLSPDQATRLLGRLVESGRLVREGQRRGARYRLPEEP